MQKWELKTSRGGDAGPGATGAPGPRQGLRASADNMFLMIRHHKTNIFMDAKELSTVFELKRIVEGIL